MPENQRNRYPLRPFLALMMLLIAFLVGACSTSGDDATTATTPEAEQPVAQQDHFEDLRQQADETYRDRHDAEQIEAAISLWQKALETETAATDETSQAEVHEAIAEAYFMLARYHHADGIVIRANEALSDSIHGGLDAAEAALQIRAPEYYAALQRGAPFEDDLPEPSTSALDALLWFAKHLSLLAQIDGVATDVSSTPVVEAIMEFVIEERPDAHHGAALRYFGVHWVERPFHRNSEHSRDAFDRGIEMEPDFLMTRLLRAQYLAPFENDREQFEMDLNAIIESATDADSEPSAENEIVRQWASELLDRGDELFD